MAPDIIVALLVSLLWGIDPVFHKIFLHKLSYKTVMAISSTFYFVFLIFFVVYNRKDIAKDAKLLNYKTLFFIGMTTLVTAFLANVMYFAILKNNKASIVSALIYSAPLFTVIFGYLFIKEHVSFVSLMGILLIVFGVICIAFGDNIRESYVKVD